MAAGAIGRPLTARVVATSAGFGPAFPDAYDYFNKPASGANLSTITVARTLDVLEAVLAPIEEVDASSAILFPEVTLVDTGATSTRETADQVSVLGQVAGGCSRWTSAAGSPPRTRASASRCVAPTAGSR